MAIKPIEIDEDETIDEGLPAGSLLKSIALLVLIVSGMIFGYFYNENRHHIQEEMVKAGVRPTTSPSPLPFKPNAAYNPDVASTLDDIKKESGSMVGSGVENVINAGSNVLGDATQNVASSVTKNVSKSVQDTAASTTQNVATGLYKNTLGQVIIQLFNQLPAPAKKDVAKELLKQLTPTKKPSPTVDPDFQE